MRKQVLVTADRGETRVAMLEAEGEPKPSKARARRRKRREVPAGWRVAEVYFERRGSRSIVGNIYKGRVDNVLPGLEAAFVDVGLEKNGFLHVDEIVLPGVETARRGRGKGGPKVSDLLQPGQEIVVQAVKDPLKTKGPRLSMELTIAGRYMVYAPTGEGIGVSRRLDDKERDRLRKEAKQLDLGGGGAIIRTAASGATRADFKRELQYLFKLNEVLQRRVRESKAPALVFQEADLSVRVVRDIFSAHFERAIVDDPKQHQRLVSFFSRTAPELVDRVELWDDDTVGLFDAYGVEPAIDGMLNRRVDLPSGGYLMIDYAEALTVIDVNTGSFTGKGRAARLEDTITQTNLEAAEAVVNQLRLRDIGGIIVIDFIDMARSRNREAVLKTLRGALDEDRTKTFVVEISPLGLVEMTRQNVTEGVREIMTKPCPVCHGEGVVKSEETIAIEISRKLRELVASRGAAGPEAYLVRLNPRVTAWFIADGARELRALEEETERQFHFEGSEGLPLDHFAITMEGSAEEVAERSVPFRAGEEVHVDLVEPHMYEPDDAVAKVDGYVISVANGVSFVGEKKLVRIEEAGRTAATAVLLGDDAEAAAAAADERKKAEARARSRRPARRRTPAARPSGNGAAAAVDGEPAVVADAGDVPATDEAAVSPAAASDDTAAAASRGDGTPASRADDAPASRGDDTASRDDDTPALRDDDTPASSARASHDDDMPAASAPALHDDAPAPSPASRDDAPAPSPDAPTTGDAADAAAAGGVATAVGDEETAPADAREGEGEALDSPPRRRGRRGGRRRSRAQTETDGGAPDPSE